MGLTASATEGGRRFRPYPDVNHDAPVDTTGAASLPRWRRNPSCCTLPRHPHDLIDGDVVRRGRPNVNGMFAQKALSLHQNLRTQTTTDARWRAPPATRPGPLLSAGRSLWRSRASGASTPDLFDVQGCDILPPAKLADVRLLPPAWRAGEPGRVC